MRMTLFRSDSRLGTWRVVGLARLRLQTEPELDGVVRD